MEPGGGGVSWWRRLEGEGSGFFFLWKRMHLRASQDPPLQWAHLNLGPVHGGRFLSTRFGNVTIKETNFALNLLRARSDQMVGREATEIATIGRSPRKADRIRFAKLSTTPKIRIQVRTGGRGRRTQRRSFAMRMREAIRGRGTKTRCKIGGIVG